MQWHWLSEGGAARRLRKKDLSRTVQEMRGQRPNKDCSEGSAILSATMTKNYFVHLPMGVTK
jgi:hypothetical protein